MDICTENNCTVYISSSKAKNYIDESLFKENKIKLAFEDFQNYPKYEQLWGSFEEKVSIVDLLFNEGPNTYKFMKYLTPNG